jgi:predicted glycoside hydrolase/deacetylase ChbG (UPF0249 family)
MSSRELQLIVNADDFGQSDDTVDATIECFAAGALTSATLMAGMPATDRALAFAREHPELGFGAHLTFSADPAEHPLADPELVPCLLGYDGKLLSTRELRMRALLGRLVPQQLEREIEAQVRAIQEAGVTVSHVDSHRHLHKFAPFRAALTRALPRLGIRRVRAVQDVYLRRPLASPTYWLGRRWRVSIRRAFETTEHFFMPSKEDRPWGKAVSQLVAALGAGSLEVGVHPGFEEGWRDRDRLAALELARSLPGGVKLVDWRTVAIGEDR